MRKRYTKKKEAKHVTIDLTASDDDGGSIMTEQVMFNKKSDCMFHCR